MCNYALSLSLSLHLPPLTCSHIHYTDHSIMAKIQIYARVRPTDGPFDGLQVSTGSNEDNNSINAQSNTLEDMITINTENKDEPPSKYSKAPGSKLQFRFSRVFGMQATQEEIFDTVARQMIDTFLDGYNGTIFAYGQTSSGKTHTIEGSGRKFIDRGLIPRTLSYIYKEIERRSSSEEEMTVHISYMEIYQDTGYDLLNPGMRPGALMVEVPKVRVW